MKNNTAPLVSICTLVYNHEPYLRECFDGFLMQKTDFAFEVLVHDDASTDNSAEIIREYTAKYPDLFKPIYQTENQYSKEVKVSVTYQYPRAKGKYIALCEGDDYWTDPLKLQKQVDILENNEEYGCVYTAYETVDTKGNTIELLSSVRHMNRSYTGDIFCELLVANFPQTLTVMFRKELINRFSPPYSFDYSLFLSIAIQQKFYYLPEKTGAYRINPKGMVQSGDLCKRFDFNAVKLYFYIEYLRDKSFWRKAEDHQKILDLLYQIDFWNLWTLRRYYSYFVEIIKLRPSSILKILPYSVRNTSFSRLIKNKLRFLIGKNQSLSK